MIAHRIGGLAAGVLVCALAACGSPAPSAAPPVAATPAPPVTATPAPAESPSPIPTAAPSPQADRGIQWARSGMGLEVGVLKVPLDVADPGGAQIAIPLARRAATDQANRIGTLLFIAGGPGEAGTDYVQGAPDGGFPEAILERFDLISFDPRGTPKGTGSPRVDCPIGPDLEAQLTALTPADPADLTVADVQAWAALMRAACESASGGILPYLSTESTVADIERIREALGEDRLSIIGQSWGTLTGVLYADTHPDRVRALVLDAPLDPAVDELGFHRDQANAAQGALDAFLAWCAATPTCAFHSGGNPRAALERLGAGLAEAPGEFDAYDLLSALHGGLVGHSREELAAALAEARDGDPSTLLAMAGPDGDADRAGYALSVGCPDLAAPSDPEAYLRLVEELRSGTADFALPGVLAVECVGWPQAAARDVRAVQATGAPPTLILSGTGDILTPHAWAEALEQELADATLLTRASKDHGSLFRRDACVDAAVASYLVNLEMPAKGTTCD